MKNAISGIAFKFEFYQVCLISVIFETADRAVRYGLRISAVDIFF